MPDHLISTGTRLEVTVGSQLPAKRLSFADSTIAVTQGVSARIAAFSTTRITFWYQLNYVKRVNCSKRVPWSNHVILTVYELATLYWHNKSLWWLARASASGHRGWRSVSCGHVKVRVCLGGALRCWMLILCCGVRKHGAFGKHRCLGL